MATQPEQIIDKNGKATTVHKSTGKTPESAKKRSAPQPKLAANGLRSVDELNDNIARLESQPGDVAAEQVLILQEIRGWSEDGSDMMSVDGVLDYFPENYNEDNEFFEASEEIRNWVLGR